MFNRGDHSAKGYDRIATVFAADPGFSVFRRFDKLSAKNLLYYQAELANIEADLEDTIARDRASGSESTSRYPFSVRDLKDSLQKTKEDDKEQWLKFREARELLERYYSALMQQKEILNFETPNDTDRSNFQQWLAQQSLKCNVYFETVAEMEIYNPKNNHDMITVSNKEQGVDKLTRWIFERPTTWYHGWFGRNFEEIHDIEFGTWHYSDRKIRSLTYIVSLIVAAVLPASCMIVLYFVKNTVARILIVVVYNLLFSTSLGLLVRARRVEIFAAVSAFAAVQVTLITTS